MHQKFERAREPTRSRWFRLEWGTPFRIAPAWNEMIADGFDPTLVLAQPSRQTPLQPALGLLRIALGTAVGRRQHLHAEPTQRISPPLPGRTNPICPKRICKHATGGGRNFPLSVCFCSIATQISLRPASKSQARIAPREISSFFTIA